MRGRLRISIAIVIGLCCLTLAPFESARAQTASQNPPDAGLGVQGALAEYTVTPGQVLTHGMVVTLGPDATPLDIQVDARGLGQGPDGAVQPLTDKEDTSRYSARSYIQKIDTPAFHLAPGATQAVKATIAVPADLTSGWRYADIYIHSLPVGAGRVGMTEAVNIPVILQVAGSTPVETGKITGLAVDKVVPGRPIQVATTVQNTGDHHYKAQDEVQILDPSGKVVATQTAPVSGTSIVPTYSRQFKVSFSLLDKLQGLAAGTYTATSKVTMPEGKVIDAQKTTFEVTTPYQPFPGIDPANLVVTNFNDEPCHDIDARRQADVILRFKDCPAKVTGTVVIGKFKQEPSGDPRFSAAPVDGGMGQTGVKWVGIGIAGWSQGTGQVQLYFNDTETKGFNLNSFLLAFSDSKQWRKLDNLGVFTGAQNVQGEIKVDVLNLNPIIALGGESAQPAGVPPPSNFPLVAAAAGGAGLVILVVIAALLAGRRRRPSTSKAVSRNRLADVKRQ